MKLTTLDHVKRQLAIALSDATDDVMLEEAILGVSARFELECNRRFERKEGETEEFEGESSELRPARYPIESVTAWELKESEATGWVALSAPDYLILKKCVLMLDGPLGGARSLVRVTYTGGYVLPDAEPAAGQTALPADLRIAATGQVAHWYQNRHRLGLTSVTAEGGSVQQFASLDLLPWVTNTLRRYERWVS